MSRSASVKKLERVASCVGYISMEWAHSENFVAQFVSLLADFQDDRVSAILHSNTDIRTNIQIAKGFCYIKQDDKLWFETAIAILNLIDNNLRIRRNSVIHAEWIIPEGKLFRRTRKMRLVKPQYYCIELETIQDTPFRVNELKRLHKDIEDVMFSFLPVFGYMMRENLSVEYPEQQVSWMKFLRITKSENPMNCVRRVKKRTL